MYVPTQRRLYLLHVHMYSKLNSMCTLLIGNSKLVCMVYLHTYVWLVTYHYSSYASSFARDNLSKTHSKVLPAYKTCGICVYCIGCQCM